MRSFFVPPKEIHTSIITKQCIPTCIPLYFPLSGIYKLRAFPADFYLRLAFEDVCLIPIRRIYPSPGTISNPQCSCHSRPDEITSIGYFTDAKPPPPNNFYCCGALNPQSSSRE